MPAFDVLDLYAYELTAKYEQGMEKGLEKGDLKKPIETARKMQELCLSIEIIEKSVGLSSKELKDLGIL